MIPVARVSRDSYWVPTVVALAIVCSVAARPVYAQQQKPVTITAPDGLFAATFPQRPEGPQRIPKVRMHFGFGTLVYYASQRRARQTFYLLGWMDYPAGYLDRAQLKVAMNEVRDTISQTRAGKVTNESDGEYAGYPSKDFLVASRFNSMPMYEHVRLVAVKDRIYRLIVGNLERQPEHGKVDAFFESFEPQQP